jgi:erythromycin esterase
MNRKPASTLKIINFLLILFLISNVKVFNGQDTVKYVTLFSTEIIQNNDDLKQLNPYFKDVKVIGMGESTHGTHEFSTMRFRMFKFLVENHGFNTFFFRSGLC